MIKVKSIKMKYVIVEFDERLTRNNLVLVLIKLENTNSDTDLHGYIIFVTNFYLTTHESRFFYKNTSFIYSKFVLL